jgi:hypothetical protein
MPRANSERSRSYIAIQTLFGLFAFAIWVTVGVWVMEEDLMGAVVRILPFFVFYEIGVLSRYFPGVREATRSVNSWNKARDRG